MQGGSDRHNQNAVTQLGQPIEAGDALGNDVLVGRKKIVRKCFPVREMQYRQIGGEETQLLFQPFSALAIGRQ
ncbi:hypothetical protein D3C73_1608560 [compost metagenome]